MRSTLSYLLVPLIMILFYQCMPQEETFPESGNNNNNNPYPNDLNNPNNNGNGNNNNLLNNKTVTCDITTLQNSVCSGTPPSCGQYGVCAVCYPTCNGEAYGTCTLTDIPSYQSKEQNCTDTLDNDCDNQIDCKDSDCSAIPSCSCGNGICEQNLAETCTTCSKDCGECADCSSCGCNCGTCDLECCPEDLIDDFVDVPKTHQYYYQIDAMKRFKLSTGCKAQPFSYCPDKALTRGESAAFVSRGLCFGPPWKTSPAPFTDVPVGHSWIGEIWALKDKGITAGKADGSFGVNEAINREDFVIFLAKSLNIQPDISGSPIFSDITDTKAYYYGFVQAYAKAGKIPGCNPNSVSCGKFYQGTNKQINRGEASDWVITAYNLKTETH